MPIIHGVKIFSVAQIEILLDIILLPIVKPPPHFLPLLPFPENKQHADFIWDFHGYHFVNGSLASR